MTNASSPKPAYGRFGVWVRDPIRPEQAVEVEKLGYGARKTVAARLTQHLDAGADHVLIRVLTSPGELVPALAILAAALGLRTLEME